MIIGYLTLQIWEQCKEKDTDFVYLSDLAEFRAMTIPEQDRYIRMIDREVVYNNVLDRKYRFGYADGEEKGIIKGRAEGLAEGLAKGLAEGAKSIARKMKKIGMTMELIVQTTGLSEEEIEKL